MEERGILCIPAFQRVLASPHNENSHNWHFPSKSPIWYHYRQLSKKFTTCQLCIGFCDNFVTIDKKWHVLVKWKWNICTWTLFLDTCCVCVCFALLNTCTQPDKTKQNTALPALTDVAEICTFDLRPQINSAHMLKVSRVGPTTLILTILRSLSFWSRHVVPS